MNTNGFYTDGRPWPKLSETLPGPKCFGVCQKCGAREEAGVTEICGWFECDGADVPTSVVLFLCEPCGDRVIERHPRLYYPVPRHAPLPGLMHHCVTCRHRQDNRCHSPLLKANGGAGLKVTFKEPMRGFMDGTTKGGGRRAAGWVEVRALPRSGTEL